MNQNLSKPAGALLRAALKEVYPGDESNHEERLAQFKEDYERELHDVGESDVVTFYASEDALALVILNLFWRAD